MRTYLDLSALNSDIILVVACSLVRIWLPLPNDVVSSNETIQIGVLFIITETRKH